MSKNLYKVDFSIDNLSLIQQEQIFRNLIKMLDYDMRQNLHITVTDSIGGKHFIWDNKGISPDGKKCNKCFSINCDECIFYRSNNNGNKNNSR